MAGRRQNRITFTTVIIALIILALYNLIESRDLFPARETPSMQSQDELQDDLRDDLRDDLVEVHFIDVGQGDSIYIKTPSQDILIDGGERGDTVVDYLRSQDVDDLELVIGTPSSFRSYRRPDKRF